MPLYRIRNLKKYQHYKNRKPPWVKLYREILEDRRYAALPDSAWRLGIEMILLASENGSDEIEGDAQWLSWKLRRKAKAQDVERLCLVEFIEPRQQHASNPLATCPETVPQRTETETETETDPPKPPRRGGGRVGADARKLVDWYAEKTGCFKPNEASYRSCQKILNAEGKYRIRKAVARYATYVREKNPDDRQHVIRAHNFFGREARWKEWLDAEIEVDGDSGRVLVVRPGGKS